MANKKISELQSRTPALSDLMLVGDPSSGYSYKCTVTALATIIETDIADGYVTIGTTQTISGAKTFSNNLTLTSVVNTPTDPDKFLTLNASNVVTYRTGAEVLSDIGGVGGSGTTNYLPKFSATTTLANSQIFDNGTNIGIATATPDATARVQINKTDGYGLYLNYNTSTGSGVTTTALYAINTTASSGYAAVIEEKTPNTTAGQYPFVIKHSLSSGTAGVGFGTGVHFQLLDDAGTSKTTQLTIENIDAAAATYKTRYRFNVQNNGSSTPVVYINGTGLGVFTASPSVALDVTGEGKFSTINNATTDTDKFLVSDSGVLKYRTGTQILSDIGAADDTLVVHLAGTETITGYKTFSSFAGFDSAISIKQNSTIVSQTGYGSIAASSTGFFLTRATGIHAFFNLNSLTTGRNFTFPDVTGTIALTSDITDALAGYVPTSRTLTINGVTQSLAANRTFNVGTVETVNFATGTTGTDVNVSGSPITTTGTITLNIPTASATNRGALSSTDWSTFNNKQSAISLTTTGNSGAATFVSNTLNIPNYTLSGLGGISGTGTTNYIPKFTSSSAIGNSLLTDNGIELRYTGADGFRVQGSTDGFLSVYGTADNYLQFIDGGGASGYIRYNHTSDFMSFQTASSERMRLTSAGNLGVNTTIPNLGGVNKAITVNSSPNTNASYELAVNNTQLGAFFTLATSNAIGLYATQNGHIQFGTNNSERMRLDASGNLGLGTSSPDASFKFTISGNSGAVTPGIYFDDQASSPTDYALYTNGSKNFVLRNMSTSSDIATFTSSGNLGLGVTPSATTGLTNQRTIEIGGVGNTLFNNGVAAFWMGQNVIYNSGYKYANSAEASYYLQSSGSHIWAIAGSGTAGNAISFTQAMTLFSTGNLAVGGTSDGGYRLNVQQSFASTNSLEYVSQFSRATSGTAANGIGGRFHLTAQDNAGGQRTAAMINWKLTNVSSAAPEGYLSLGSRGSEEALSILHSGNIGISTTSPTSKLQINSTSAGAATVGMFLNNESNTLNTEIRLAFAANTNNDIATNRYSYISAINTSGANGQALLFATNETGNSAVERMRITSGGNVGIGSSSPNISNQSANARVLTLQGSSAFGVIELATGDIDVTGSLLGAYSFANRHNSATYNLPAYIGAWVDGATAGQRGADMRFFTQTNGVAGAAERMRITSGGELLINTTSDAGDYKLQVNGSTLATNYWTPVSASNGYYLLNYNTSNASSRNWRISNDVDTFGDFGVQVATTQGGSTYTNSLILTSTTAVFNGSIKTAAPSGGTAKPIKFGEIVTLGGSNTQGVRVEIDGTVYYLVTGYLP